MFHTKINWRKILPVAMGIAGVVFFVCAILIFAIAVPKADLAYKRVLEVICAILMILLAGLCALYLWLSRDTFPNFFLYDRKKKKNIPVEKLTYAIIMERMTFLLSDLADSPEDLWKGEVLLHEDDKFGYKSVYKPLVAYKLLFDLGEQRCGTSYWSYFKSAPKENMDAICGALERAGEKKMVAAFRMLLTNYADDDAKMKEFLAKNNGYIRSKMKTYIVSNIEWFY